MRTKVILAFVLVFATTCALASEVDYKAIAELNRRWDEALNEGKTDALLNLITDDHIRSAPGQPQTIGKAAFLEVVTPFMKTYRFENSTRILEEVRLSAHWAFLRGTWSAKIIPISGDAPSVASAKWANICERQPDGTYKISRAYSY
jgi:ketosteroid isomerase-like protein